MTRGLRRALGVLATLALITAGYHAIPPSFVLTNKAVQYLFFLPVTMGALWFGWLGGLATAAAAAVCYLPRIIAGGGSAYSAEQYGELLDFLVIGGVLGFLAERERRYRNQLEETGAELRRTYEKLQASLESLKQAERLSAVGQLSANLAHEIRNPLASIGGAAELLQTGGLDRAETEEFLEIIRKESKRLGRLLTDLLDYARPKPPEFGLVSVDSLAGPTAGLLSVVAAKSNVTLTVEPAPDLPPLRCDPGQIKQVLVNLVMNAIQAMPGGGEVRVSARREGGRVAIEVRDQGEGIAAKDLGKIFSPFYTTKKAGTGLGLAVAQQIAIGHGGEMRVEANSPRGAVFTVLLPAAPA